MSRSDSIRLLVLVLALFTLGISDRAQANCDTPILSIQVDSIFARETGTDVDQRLGAEKGRLQNLFDYGSYRLLRSEEVDTPCGEDVTFLLPEDRILHVKILATHGNLVALTLALSERGRPVLQKELKVSRGGLLLLVGSHNPQDAYITTLSVHAPGGFLWATPLGTAGLPATPSPPIGNPMTVNQQPVH
jgi:hypothetical protein